MPFPTLASLFDIDLVTHEPKIELLEIFLTPLFVVTHPLAILVCVVDIDNDFS